jgi:predicted NBD/HSP70 family sugar kinase
MVTSRAATDSGGVRQRNLAAVLQFVHQNRGVTRADLTRALGLNRSTIGDLVAALADAHWVDEVDDAPREGVGRPSPRVVPRTDRLVAAVNPELDSVEVALVALGGHVVARQRVVIDSPTVDQAVSIAARVVGELASEHPSSRVVAAGAAIPGLVRTDDGVVRFAPHLGWREEAFAAPLARALGVPAFAANDAQLGCRAELAFGAGLGARTMVYLNGGASGIGGGIVMGGQLVGGRDGHAGEFGHLSVDPLGPVCACGARGCLEAVVSRAYVTAALGLEHPDDAELEAALTAADSSVTGPIVTDQFAALRVALRTIATMVNPELIVLGGYLATLWTAASTDDRRTVLDEALPAIAADVRIAPAALGAHRLLIGAAEHAWAAVIDDPLAG